MSAETDKSATITFIKPSGSWLSLDLKDLLTYRELLYFLTWRDVKVRYKQTAIGVLWAILQPVLTTVLFTVIFSTVARFESQNVPYPLFALSGFMIWLFVSYGKIARPRHPYSPETLTANLRRLVTEPALRETLGRAGRRYVEKYHSFATAQYMFGAIYRRILDGDDVDLMRLFHPLVSPYVTATPRIVHPLTGSHLPPG